MINQYKSHYFDDPALKSAFEEYAKTVFGLDFGRWKEHGLWDPKYVPFSAFNGDECISSICVYPSDVTVEGKKERWAQLLTVGTLPEYRKKGIQYKLWKMANSWIRDNCEQVFLFTDDSASGFYEKLGFKRVEEYYDVINAPTRKNNDRARFRKIDLENDDDFRLVKRILEEREPVSDRLGFINPNFMLFIYLYSFNEWIYYLEEFDAILVIEEKADGVVRIHDIAAERMLRFSDIEQFISRFQKNEIEFYFCTDKLGLTDVKKRQAEDSILFVGNNFSLEGDFIFPSSIRD